MTQEEIDSFKQLILGNVESLKTGNRITYFSTQVDEAVHRTVAKAPGCRSLWMDIDRLNEWNPHVVTKLLNNTGPVLDAMDRVLEEVLREKYTEEFLELGHFHARPLMAPGGSTSGFETYHSEMVGRVITIRGVITAINETKPYPTEIKFKCVSCGTEYIQKITIEDPYHPPPRTCPNTECPNKKAAVWDITAKDSRFIDIQFATIQEESEYMKARVHPRSTTVAITDDLVDMLKPGARAIVTGTLVAIPEFKENTKNYDYPTFKTHMHARSIRIVDTNNDEINNLTERRIEEIHAFVAENSRDRKKYFSILTRAVAPMIEGYEIIKIALLAALFSGQLYLPPGGRSRGFIHILLYGDPGTGKTAMIKALQHLDPRFKYASGQAATKAGLTAAVVDGDHGPEIVAGLVVLADGGIAAIDEFEKMREEDRSGLLEQMESQTVTLNKWKFRETMNARCSVIAAANPKFGRVLDPVHSGKTIQEQLNMITLPILSRFDAIFLIRDIPNVEKDKMLTRKIREARSRRYARPLMTSGTGSTAEIAGETDEIKAFINLVRDLIAYGRKYADEHPIEVLPEAKEYMDQMFLKERMQTIDPATGDVRPDLAINITPRQYESIDRFAAAFAKARLSSTVDIDDVKIAEMIIAEFMRQTMVNEAGEIDPGMMETGVSKAKINAKDIILTMLYQMLQDTKSEDGIELKVLKKKIMAESKITDVLFKESIEALKRDEMIVQFGNNLKLTSDGVVEITGARRS